MTFYKWSTTAATNNNIDSTINWAEGQAPSTVNNSARAMMAALAKYRNDMRGTVLTGGSSTAYTATSNEVYTVYADGDSIAVQIHTTSGAAPTLNMDGLGAKAIRTGTGAAIGTARLVAGSIQRFTYDLSDDCWYVHGFLPDVTEIPATTVMLFWQAAAPTAWTKLVTQNNKALRVVSGTGGGTGGSVDFTTAFASQTPAGTVGGTSLTEAQLPSHKHFILSDDFSSAPPVSNVQQVSKEAIYGNNASYNLAGNVGTAQYGLTSATGSGSTHTHTFTGNAINLAVSYIDIILCSKD